MVSDKGGPKGFVYRSRWKAYRRLKTKTGSKKIAAMISNAGRTHAARSRMAKKAARTRKRRGER